MNNIWAENEFNLVQLGDKRLNKRLSTISEQFINSPESPINQACTTSADTKAAYRFFQNDKVSNEEITRSHSEITKQRCREHQIILTIQDTTYFNYSDHPKTEGLCAIGRNRGKHKNNIPTDGLIMHSTLATTTGGLPLGIINQKIYARPELSEEEKEKKKRSHNVGIPIEEKDSYRWLEALTNTCNAFAGHSSNIVTICDREADIYDFFHHADKLKTQILVRASHNRKVNKSAPYSDKTGIKLWELLKTKEPIGSIDIKIPKQKDRPERIARCLIKISELNFTPPRNLKDSKDLPHLKLYAIYMSEEKSEKDSIDWMLLTNISTENLEQAIEKIQWYCIRWRIETFHKVLKSGLKVEDCRLKAADRLIRYLSVMSIIAWRIFYITLISRVCPNVSCNILFDDVEWKLLFRKFNKTNKLPKKEPSVKQCITWVAMLGGFLNRKSDGDPGIIYIWRGMKKFANMLEGVELLKDIYG